MTDKNGVEVNHFEPAPPMHHVGDIQEKNTPRAPPDNSQIDRPAA